MSDAISSRDATAQAEAIERGETNASALVEAAIARIEKHNPALNAVIHQTFERAREVAAGPLPDGPFTVEDRPKAPPPSPPF